MDRNTLVQALHSTTIADGQKQAGEFLDQCSKVDGFGPELLKITCDASQTPEVRQAAVIYFKNAIVKYWELDDDENQEDGQKPFVINDGDKKVIKSNLLEAVCIASDTTRSQLCVAAHQIMRTDFPEKWPELLPELQQKLVTLDANALQGALLVLYRMAKVYEYRRSKEREPLVEVMKVLLPVMQQHFGQLAPNQSQESVTIQKLILKIFFTLVQFSLNFNMIPIPAMDVWIQYCIEVLKRPLPDEVNQVEDLEERALMVWWKCKKWAIKILDRVFERYGAPGQVESSYADFANHFLQNFSIPCLEVMMTLLNDVRQRVFVSNRVLHLALSFMTTSVSHSHTWRALKPHVNEIITTVLFPLLCHSDEDEEMWEDDVEEYVRFKYDIYEDLHNPSYGAGALLAALAKRKDVVHPVLQFTITTMASSQNPREIDGALRMIGELSSQLCKSKKYKKDVEKLLDAHVINRLEGGARFVRARAAWCIKQYSGALFSTNKILKRTIEGLIKALCNPDEELPGSVESALALGSLLEDQEKAYELIRPSVGSIIPRVLQLVAKSQIEDVVGVMDELMDKYMDDMIPIAASVADQLATMFLTILASEAAEDRAPALMSIISTLTTVLDVVCDHREIMAQVEISVLRVIDYVFTTSNIDYYSDVLLLIQSLIAVYISEPMWRVFDMIYQLVKHDDGAIILEFADVVPVLHLYVVTDTESFLARPERLNAIIDMCKGVLESTEVGDENQLYAAKLLEVLILQCNGMINEAIPAIVVIALERLTKPFEDGLSELKHMLLLVVIAALYTNTELAVRVLKELAPNHPNPLDYITEQLAELSGKFEGVHNRKMAVLAWCTLLQLPAEYRPSIVTYEPKKVIKSFLNIFTGLQRALKVQAEIRKADDSDSDESDDEAEDSHRKIDDDLSDNDDEIDDTALEYLAHLEKERKQHENDESDDSEDGSLFEEETDTEQYHTPVDVEGGPDVFVAFKRSFEDFKNREGILFNQMISNLTEGEAKELQELDQTCDNHVKAEQSKQLKDAGGYAFSAEAVVPGNFNFGA